MVAKAAPHSRVSVGGTADRREGNRSGALFEKYYAANLGRFRIWATADEKPAVARALPTDIEALLLVPAAERTADQQARLLAHYRFGAPELAGERNDDLQVPRADAIVSDHARVARAASNEPAPHEHSQARRIPAAHRASNRRVAEFVCFPPGGRAHDRLALARWLVSDRNPLAAA